MLICSVDGMTGFLSPDVTLFGSAIHLDTTQISHTTTENNRNCVKIAKSRQKLSAASKLNSRLLFSADENRLKTAGWSCWREAKLKHRLAERYFLL